MRQSRVDIGRMWNERFTYVIPSSEAAYQQARKRQATKILDTGMEVCSEVALDGARLKALRTSFVIFHLSLDRKLILSSDSFLGDGLCKSFGMRIIFLDLVVLVFAFSPGTETDPDGCYAR